MPLQAVWVQIPFQNFISIYSLVFVQFLLEVDLIQPEDCKQHQHILYSVFQTSWLWLSNMFFSLLFDILYLLLREGIPSGGGTGSASWIATGAVRKNTIISQINSQKLSWYLPLTGHKNKTWHINHWLSDLFNNWQMLIHCIQLKGHHTLCDMSKLAGLLCVWDEYKRFLGAICHRQYHISFEACQSVWSIARHPSHVWKVQPHKSHKLSL